MKIKNIYLLFLLVAVSNFHVFSQIRKANKYFELYQYAEAIPYYLRSVESSDKADRIISVQRLADCYRLTSNFSEARKWYGKAVLVNGADPINYYYLGQSLRSLGAYNEAADAFQTFAKLLPDSLNGKQYYQFCVDIQKWLDLPEMAEVKNARSINSKYSDFCPVFYRDGLVFASDRREDMLDKDTYGWTNFGFLNLYCSEPEYSGNFWGAMGFPARMEGNFNHSYHDGPVCFSPDLSSIYITRTTKRNAKKDEGKIKTYLLQIYSARLDKNGGGAKYSAFPFNSREYSVAHPTLSANGDKMIFSSDMPGGFGGSDLYMSSFVGGKWAEPVNLGEGVNTLGNEVFPFWANDSVLFFSSEGHLGYGGLDIFQSALSPDGWMEPENLKMPINSSYDDFGILLNKDLDGGFFSSNRPEGEGSDDIYAFRNLKRADKEKEQEEGLERELKEETKLLVRGLVKDKKTKAPLEMATVFVFNPGSEGVLVLKTKKDGSYETPLDFDTPYVAKAMKNGFIYDCTFFRTPENETATKFDVPQDLLLAKLEVDQVFTVENIYYDLDKWFIRDDARPPLDNLVQIMKQYPIQAELSSHTDSRASYAYNMELSRKRAESAVRYIILQGVAPYRITAKGYGETKLVNRCADGVACTEEEHQANRRTEFKITAIDQKFIKQGQFDPDLFKEGDIVHIKMFDADFFRNCLN